MKHRFHWDEWNLEHIQKHQITRAEAEFVLGHAAPPFPREVDAEKFLVRGATSRGRLIQVIYVFHDDTDIDYETMAFEDIIEISEIGEPLLYVIHARELTAREKSKYRQSR